MNPSYLYHAFGVRHQECTKTEYKGNQNIHYIQIRKDELCCPECKSRKIIRSGSIYRDIRSVPVGHRETILRMKVQAYGYRDEKFFELKILSLHDKTYAFVG